MGKECKSCRNELSHHYLKHHDGFAMYDSKVSDFNIMQQTAWKHDPMADLSAACKKYGLKFGFYYSHAFDWEHPDAPGNDWEYKNPGGDLNLFDGRNWYDLHPELLPKAVKYVNEKAIPQIKELLIKYHPDILVVRYTAEITIVREHPHFKSDPRNGSECSCKRKTGTRA
jgi:alpha-L-fucosidase